MTKLLNQIFIFISIFSEYTELGGDEELPLGEGRRVTDAFYELRHDGSGQPYENLLDLRRDKIRNFLQVADFPNISRVLCLGLG